MLTAGSLYQCADELAERREYEAALLLYKAGDLLALSEAYASEGEHLRASLPTLVPPSASTEVVGS